MLGPLRVSDSSGEITVGGARLRALLGLLLMRAGRTVTRDQLAEAVWDSRLSSRSPAALPSYVMRLRRALGREAGSRVVTRSGGYAVELRDGELDLVTFQDSCERAQTLRELGDLGAAERVLGEALGLWRGEPVADVPDSAVLRREVEALESARMRARHQHIDLRLRLGQHADLLGELGARVETQPFDERMRAQLMLALHRSGRRADALEVFQTGRRMLVEQLAIEPCSELQELHRAVLADDPSLLLPGHPGATAVPTAPGATAVPATPGAAAVLAAPVARPGLARPAQLPADLADFTGRSALVARLEELLHSTADHRHDGPLVLTALDGAGGIGKTALAVHVAHRVRSRFPDGQLQADLHGAGAPPADPSDLLGRFLRGLGVAQDDIPPDFEERAALYRSTLAERRVLILLDNVKDAAQVRPLLPGSGSCAVLITSRSALPGLDGVRRLTVDVLDDREALELFTRIVGSAAAAAFPEAVASVLRSCAGLPLAIRIAASRLACQPGWTVQTLADELRDESRLLDALQVEDRAVRSSFALGISGLSRGDAEAFGLLGLWNGPDITPPAAAALLDVETRGAQRTLDLLARLHLLEAGRPHRYAFHDLVRVFARERAAADVPAEGREAALDRLLAWYLNSADAAARVMTPQRRHAVSDQVQPGRQRLEFDSYDAAQNWLDAEHRNLMAALGTATTTGRHDAAMRLPTALWELFNHRGHWDDWIAACTLGLTAATLVGDDRSRASLLIDLGSAQLRAGRLAEAVGSYRSAIPMRHAQGDTRGEAAARYNLGNAYFELQRLDEAREMLEAALALHRSIGNRFGEGATLSGLGQVALALGDPDRGLTLHTESMAVYQELGDRYNTAIAYEQLTLLLYSAGRPAEAVTAARQGIEANHEVGHPHLEGRCWEYLGMALAARGDREEAVSAFHRARSLLADSDPGAEARITRLLALEA
ncbi:DNA-binding SARP family transcriptional activator [Kitasatospora sp. MAP12-15]|nr:DNA-binding SARP family transcriptional activator [Kitasatospora sp. MAP12-44]